MIITISGAPGSGKSTVARAVAKELKLRHYSSGDFMRRIAEKRKLSLGRLSKLAEKDYSIDCEVDDYVKKLAKKNNFVIDSRLAFHFIPDSIKVFLKVRPEIAAMRILKDVRANKRPVELEKNKKEVLSRLLLRMKSESKRYKKYYRVDYLNRKNYDLVVDTSCLSIKQAVVIVLDYVREKFLKH